MVDFILESDFLKMRVLKIVRIFKPKTKQPVKSDMGKKNQAKKNQGVICHEQSQSYDYCCQDIVVNEVIQYCPNFFVVQIANERNVGQKQQKKKEQPVAAKLIIEVKREKKKS